MTDVETCFFCRKPVLPDASDLAEFVSGWVERRSAGGGHAIRLRSKPVSLAHQSCLDREVERRRAGVLEGQEALAL